MIVYAMLCVNDMFSHEKKNLVSYCLSNAGENAVK